MKFISKLLLLLTAVITVNANADTFSASGIFYKTTGASTVAVAAVPQNVNTIYKGIYIIPEQVYYDGVNYKVTSIADSAFCHSLATEVQLPNSVTAIGKFAFAYDEDLNSITLPLHLKQVSQSMLAGTNLVNIAVPEGVKVIDQGAFQSCGQLHTVLLPSTTTTIQAYGFNNCHNLYEIYCAAPTPPTATGWAIFLGLSNIDVIVPDDEAVAAYAKDPVWGNDSTFRLYPNEDLSVTMSNALEQYNDSYMRLDLGNNLGYKIYAGDDLIAYTAADHYYLPITAQPTQYTIYPTTGMGNDADPITVTVQPTAAPQIEEDLNEWKPVILARDGVIYITGDNHGTWTRIYDCYGQLYYERPSNDGEIEGLPRNKVYIVVVGKTVKKVFL